MSHRRNNLQALAKESAGLFPLSRTGLMLLIGAILTVFEPSLAAFAQAGSGLESVTVGGEIRIRGNWWVNAFNAPDTRMTVAPALRWSRQVLGGRPIGDAIGQDCVYSYRDWDEHGSDLHGVGERVTLNVRADFVQDVTTFIEFDSANYWGDGVDPGDYAGSARHGALENAVDVYQAYVEMRDLFGAPLRLRIGRQELDFGSGWLVGNGSDLPEFVMLSFDGLRATYTLGPLSIDAFYTKLLEQSSIEQDGDIDFAGFYARYEVCTGLSLDAYWMLLRDAGAITEQPEDIFMRHLVRLAYDNYDFGVTELHTMGLRLSGNHENFDYNLETAYQFGPADRLGSMFHGWLLSDTDAEFDAWAAHAELGYTMETTWTPRIFAQGAYFYGEDNRDITFAQWLNPFDTPRSSISFNRLFSNVSYSDILDHMAQLSNYWTLQAGLTLKPSENITLQSKLAHFRAIEAFDNPWHVRVGRSRMALPMFSFLTTEASNDLGWELVQTLRYVYGDATFTAGWAHLFTGNGLSDGNYTDLNGLLSTGGTDSEDADYYFLEVAVRF